MRDAIFHPDEPTSPGRSPAADRQPSRTERAPAEGDSASADAMRQAIRAYPGTLTYLDLIRKNKRQSVVLIIAMILLAVIVGGAIGAAIGIRLTPADQGSSGINDTVQSLLIPGAITGAIIGLVLASGGAAWSFFGGANAILRMAHAKELTKADDPELFNVVDEMRIAAGLPMPRVFLINDTAMNAFATGRDPAHAAVAITRGLRDKLTRDELQGVMAHEISHIRHNDIRFAMLMATMVGLIVFAADAFLRATWYSGGRVGGSRRSNRDGGKGAAVMLVIALVLAVLAPFFARLIQMSYSRQREYLADAGAVELTRYPQGLASALSKLANDDEPLVDTANRGTAHMYIVNPLRKMRQAQQQLNSAFSSHPPVEDRIARLLALAR